MLPQSYEFSHGLCLNNFLQVLLVGNQRDQIPPFIYINQDYGVSCFFRRVKGLEYMIYLFRSVKQTAEVVRILTEDNWDVKRVNSVYTMLYGRFNFKRNNRFDSLSWPSFVRNFLYKEGLYYWRIKRGTRAGLASAK